MAGPTAPTYRRLPRINRGDIITANPFLNGLVDQVNENTNRLARPSQTDEPRPESGEIVGDFITCDVLIENDWSLICLSPNGELIRIGKPFELGGATATRTVNGENQIIIPPYEVGSVIYAFRNMVGGTRLAIEDGTGDPNSAMMAEWMDMNVAARAWAEDTG